MRDVTPQIHLLSGLFKNEFQASNRTDVKKPEIYRARTDYTSNTHLSKVGE